MSIRAFSRLSLTTLVSLALGAPLLNGTASAQELYSARVVAATPLYERVAEPRQECRMEPVAGSGAPQQERGYVAPIVGGVAGAVLGSQVGQGRGRDVATAVGAVGGTVVGDRVGNPGGGDRNIAGSVVGGLAGALLGNQVGRGTGNTVATAAGAIAGSMIGDRVANPGNRSAGAPQQVERCRTVDAGRDVLKGYSVVYRHNDRDYTAITPNHPGDIVRVTADGSLVVAATPAPAPRSGPAPVVTGGPSYSPQPSYAVQPSSPSPQNAPSQPAVSQQQEPGLAGARVVPAQRQQDEPRANYNYRYQ